MKTPDATILVKIPTENARVIHERISVFLDKYHKEQQHQSVFTERPFLNMFDLKALAYSCYLQGLADAKESITNADNIVLDV